MATTTKSTSTYGYHSQKAELLKRLSRAEGQVRGIARMVNDDVYCLDVLTQISAAQAALDKVALALLQDHTAHCLADTTLTTTDRQAKAEELVKAVSRLVAR